MAGLSGLIGVGRRQKEQALGGLGIAAQQEASRKVANEQIEAQTRAANMNLVGTGAGIAGASLLTKAGTAVRGATMSAVPGGAAAATALANPGAAALGLTAGTTTTTGAALAAGGTTAGTAAAAGGTAAAGGASAALLAAAPWAALIIGGGYLLKKLFD